MRNKVTHSVKVKLPVSTIRQSPGKKMASVGEKTADQKEKKTS